MDGWMDGWVGGWMDEWMGGWVDGWMDGFLLQKFWGGRHGWYLNTCDILTYVAVFKDGWEIVGL
jgi:hypothetical protein